jgi:hypothetical protein
MERVRIRFAVGGVTFAFRALYKNGRANCGVIEFTGSSTLSVTFGLLGAESPVRILFDNGTAKGVADALTDHIVEEDYYPKVTRSETLNSYLCGLDPDQHLSDNPRTVGVAKTWSGVKAPR